MDGLHAISFAQAFRAKRWLQAATSNACFKRLLQMTVRGRNRNSNARSGQSASRHLLSTLESIKSKNKLNLLKVQTLSESNIWKGPTWMLQRGARARVKHPNLLSSDSHWKLSPKVTTSSAYKAAFDILYCSPIRGTLCRVLRQSCSRFSSKSFLFVLHFRVKRWSIAGRDDRCQATDNLNGAETQALLRLAVHAAASTCHQALVPANGTNYELLSHTYAYICCSILSDGWSITATTNTCCLEQVKPLLATERRSRTAKVEPPKDGRLKSFSWDARTTRSPDWCFKRAKT